MLLVPLGYEDLEEDNFSPIAQEQVLTMIRAYGERQAKRRLTHDKADLKPYGSLPNEATGCWFCVDVFLKLMGIAETEESL
jgi:hypothetical protein